MIISKKISKNAYNIIQLNEVDSTNTYSLSNINHLSDKDIVIAKNYLSEDELLALNRSKTKRKSEPGVTGYFCGYV